MLTFFQPACDLIAGHLDSNGLLAVKRVNRQGYYWGSYNWFIHATVSNKRKWLLKYLPHITRNPNCISQRFAEVIINFANDFNTPITLRILCLGAKIFIPNSGANDADLRLLKTFAARETLLPYVCFVMYHSLHATEKESVIEWLKASINEVLEDIGKLCDAFSKSIHFGIEARKYNLQRAENYLSAKQCMTTSVMLYHHLSQEDKIYISEKLLIMFQKDHPRDWVTIPIVMFGMFYATEYNNESSNNYLVKVIQRISIAGALDYGLEEECFNELLFILQKNDPSKIKNIVGPILDSIFDPINKHPSYGLKHLFYRLCPKLPKPVRARCFEQTLVLAESNQSHYESKKYIEYLIKFYMLEDKPEDQELAMRVAELERLCNIVKDGLPVPATPEHIDVQNLVQAVFDGHYTEGGIEGFPQLSRCSDYPPPIKADMLNRLNKAAASNTAEYATNLARLIQELLPQLQLIHKPGEFTSFYDSLPCSIATKKLFHYLEIIALIGSKFPAESAFLCLTVLQQVAPFAIFASYHDEFTGTECTQYTQKRSSHVTKFIYAASEIIPSLSESLATNYLGDLVVNFANHKHKYGNNEQFLYFLIINLVHYFPAAISNLPKRDILDKILSFFPNSDPSDADYENRARYYGHCYPFEEPRDLFPRGIDGQLAYEEEVDNVKKAIMHAVSALWPHLSEADQERCCTELANKQFFHCQKDNPMYQSVIAALDRKLEEQPTKRARISP